MFTGHQMFAKYFLKNFTCTSKNNFSKTLAVKVKETFLQYYTTNTNKWENGQKRNERILKKIFY